MVEPPNLEQLRLSVRRMGPNWVETDPNFEDALVRKAGSASMRTIETVVETYLDALAEGEQ